NAGGFAQDFQSTGCEDWDLWLRLGLHGARLVTIPRVGAYYRRYGGSLSTQCARMLENRGEGLFRLHERILQRPDLLDRWGTELLRAECRVRRRCLAQGLESRYVLLLCRAIDALKVRHVRMKQNVARQLLESFLGGRSADQLLLTYLR